MSAKVAAVDLFRLLENAIPTLENKRSTDADVAAGMPKYCRAMTDTFGNSDACAFHHSALRTVALVLVGDLRPKATAAAFWCHQPLEWMGGWFG